MNEQTLTKYVAISLKNMSENAFRSIRTGRLNKDLETCMELNKIIRSRQDLTIRMKFVPPDIGVNEVFFAEILAQRAAKLNDFSIRDDDF